MSIMAVSIRAVSAAILVVAGAKLAITAVRDVAGSFFHDINDDRDDAEQQKQADNHHDKQQFQHVRNAPFRQRKNGTM